MLGQQLVDVDTGKAVEGGPLLRRPQQAQLIGLPMHGDQVLAERPEQPDRHAPATQMRPRAALYRHRAAGQQRAVVVALRAGLEGPH